MHLFENLSPIKFYTCLDEWVHQTFTTMGGILRDALR